MNPKAICADMAFHNPHDMQAFYRMHKTKRHSTGTHTPWPNRAETGVRSFKKFLSALVDTASKNLDQTTLAQITPAQLMRKSSNGEIHTGNSEWINVCWIGHGRETKRSYGPSCHESRTADIHINQTGPSHWGDSKVGNANTSRSPTTRRHSPWSCWRNDVCSSRSSSGRKCVVLARRSEQTSARTEFWKMVENGDYCPMAVISSGASIFR